MAETEAQRSRRRWITFGEIVAVLALLISAASFWDAHQDHVRSIAAPRIAATPDALVLRARVAASGARLELAPAHADQVIETQVLTFPAGLHDGPVETTGNARIEAAWFGDALAKAMRGAGAGHRVAVGIETRFTTDGSPHVDRALYDIGFTLHPRFLRGTVVRLEGISLVRRGIGTDVRTAVAVRWAGQQPPLRKDDTPLK